MVRTAPKTRVIYTISPKEAERMGNPAIGFVARSAHCDVTAGTAARV